MNPRLNWLNDPKHATRLRELANQSIRKHEREIRKYAPKNRERSRRYQQEHPDRMADTAVRRRARIRGQAPDLSPDDRGIILTIRQAAQRVERCTGIPFDVDHVTPLARGGKHVPENMRVMPAYWNRKKSAKTPEQFAQVLEALGVSL